ncbi:M28 family peptidase [Tepidimicrobium xylanilyticum]|uniref:Peptidase family M28 n=1 Tax=Tepidimicrobium xylanilyticum TaxID=1123352 RepID=A0A1H3ECV3_9FIRM|nr:M28 family peptidase [Tepidimicrobium xylanilyticum]SDX76430.1 Peptidase family M28 [Tepidimicrobium xylanilyticum]
MGSKTIWKEYKEIPTWIMLGNIFGIWSTSKNEDKEQVMVGSHIDTVIDAGIYDGCYGVISGIEVIETLIEEGFKPYRRL